MNPTSNNLVKNAYALAKTTLALAVSTVLLGKEAPKDSPLNIAGKSVIGGINSVAEQIVKAVRVEKGVKDTAAKE